MRKLTVVGMGPGSQSCLTLEALEALRKADLIVGAGRLLETLPEGCSKNRKIAVSAQAVCDAVYSSDSSLPCVVCTGDTGCYSLCTGLGKYWDGELSILPGIGSMSYLAAKLQLPWQDWKVVSAHGRACDPVAAVTENPEVFFLTGPDNTAQELCRQLMQAGFGGCRAYVGEKLSYPEERIVSGTVREIAEKIFAPLAVLVVKPTGLLVITDTMLNRVTQNWKKGKRTHVFIDEFHVVFENEFSAAFFNSAWRQFRKRNAFPTAITQNVEYLLDSVQASTMLSNSEFIVMLNQAASDREKLGRLLNISNEQMNYITNVEAGSGLIKYGSALVPFINRFPKNTKLYQLMTTRPGEGRFAGQS